MPQQGTPFTIPLGGSGMVPQPNRWRSQPGELSLAQNHTLENDLLQKEPAAAYYNVGGAGRPMELVNLTGQFFDQSVFARAGVCCWFQCTAGATPAETTSGFGAAGNAGPLWLVNNVGPVPAGAAHLIAISRDNNVLSPFGLATVIVDNVGNQYTLLFDSGVVMDGGAPSMRAQLWGAVLTTALPANGQLIITLAQPSLNVCLVARWYPDIASLTPIAHQPITPEQWQFSTLPTTVVGPEFMRAHTYPIRGVGALASDTDFDTPPCSVEDNWSITSIPGGNSGQHLLTEFSLYYTGLDAGIIAQIEWNSLAVSQLTGTATVTRGSPIITGTGTAFTTQLRPGDQIITGSGEMGRIASVQSDTQSTALAPWQVTVAPAQSLQRRAGPVLVTANLYDYQNGRGLDIYKEKPKDGLHGQINGSTLVTLASTTTRRVRFIPAGQEVAANPRKLFAFTGTFPVQVLAGDGATMAPISKPALDWSASNVTDPNRQPTNGIVFGYCLIAFGNANVPHQIYISNPEDHEDFQTLGPSPNQAIFLNIASNVGERLWCAAIFQGVCFLFKYPLGIFYIDTSNGPDRLSWGYLPRSYELGCAPSPYAVLATDDDVVFCDPTAHFHLLSSVSSLGGTADSDLTRLLGLQQWTDANVDLPSLQQMTSVFDNTTKTAWFGLRSKQAVAGGNPNNDLVIRFDVGNPVIQGTVITAWGNLSAPRVTIARCWVADALCMKHRNWIDRNAVVISGHAQSYLFVPLNYGWRVDRDFISVVDVTSGIPSIVTCSEMDFDQQAPGKLRNVRKHFTALEPVIQQQPFSQTLTVQIWIDAILRQTLQFKGGVPRRRYLQKLNCGDGYSITLTATTDGSVPQDLGLVGFIIYYHPTGTDMSRAS